MIDSSTLENSKMSSNTKFKGSSHAGGYAGSIAQTRAWRVDEGRVDEVDETVWEGARGYPASIRRDCSGISDEEMWVDVKVEVLND